MKKFNLEEALAGKPVVTRKGVNVTSIFHAPEVTIPSAKVIAIIHGHVFFYYENGKFSTDCPSDNDLFMKSEKKKLFMGIKIHKNSVNETKYWFSFQTNIISEYKTDVENDIEKNKWIDWQIVEFEIDV